MKQFQISAAAEKALDMLNAAGYEAYLVGGCVRDLIMGKTPKDWDIAASAVPEETAAVFAQYRVIETGLRHGTVTVLIDGEPLEITTYRRDGAYSDGRHPDSVTFTRSLHEDLSRRDFTMNALAYSPKEGVRDDFGGEKDIHSRVIRCVGDPRSRFREDALRILRALRFAAVLDFQIEAETEKALFEQKALMQKISAERIREEMTGLLCGQKAGEVLRRYGEILSVPIPEIGPMIGFEQNNYHHCFDVWRHTAAVVENSPATPVSRWAALLHDVGKPGTYSVDAKGVGHFYGHVALSGEMADRILRRLKFDNATRERILTLIRHHDMRLPPEPKNVKKLVRRVGEELFLPLINLFRADNLGQAAIFRHLQQDFDRMEEIYNRIMAQRPCLSRKDLAVNGDDLIALGYDGRETGRALEFLLQAVIEEKVENYPAALLDYLKRRYRKGS